MYGRNLLLAGMLTGGLLLAGSVAAAEPQQVWQATGLDGPESAVLDAAQGVIYVSNVNGDAAAADGNGYIAKLSMKGEIDPALAARIVMEAAIPMSKIDPLTVPKE